MILQANAESGINGSAVVGSSEWDTISTNLGASTIYSSAAAIHGSLGYNSTSASTGTNGYTAWDVSLPSGFTEMWTRMYANIPVQYGGQLSQCRYQNNPVLRLVLNGSNNLRLVDPSANPYGLSNTVIPINAPFRIETHLILSASPTGGTVEVRIFLDPESLTPTEIMGPYIGVTTAAGIDAVWFGPVASGGVATLYHDDDAFSTDGWIGPALLAIPWYGV